MDEFVWKQNNQEEIEERIRLARNKVWGDYWSLASLSYINQEAILTAAHAGERRGLHEHIHLNESAVDLTSGRGVRGEYSINELLQCSQRQYYFFIFSFLLSFFFFYKKGYINWRKNLSLDKDEIWVRDRRTWIEKWNIYLLNNTSFEWTSSAVRSYISENGNVRTCILALGLIPC